MSDQQKQQRVVSLLVPKISMGGSSSKRSTASVVSSTTKSETNSRSSSRAGQDQDDEDSRSRVSETSSLPSISSVKNDDEPGRKVSPSKDQEGNSKKETNSHQDEQVAGPSSRNNNPTSTAAKPQRSVAVKRTNPRPKDVVPAKRRPGPPRPSLSSSSNGSPAKKKSSPGKSTGAEESRKKSKSPSRSPSPASPSFMSNTTLFESLLARKNNSNEGNDYGIVGEEEEDIVVEMDVNEGNQMESESRNDDDKKNKKDSDDDEDDIVKVPPIPNTINQDQYDDDDDSNDSLFEPISASDPILQNFQPRSSIAAQLEQVSRSGASTSKVTPKKTPTPRKGKVTPAKRGGGRGGRGSRGGRGRGRNNPVSSPGTNRSSSVASFTPTPTKSGRGGRNGGDRRTSRRSTKQEYIDLYSSSSNSRSPSPLKIATSSMMSISAASSNDSLFVPVSPPTKSPTFPSSGTTAPLTAEKLRKLIKERKPQISLKKLTESEIERATRRNTGESSRNNTAQLNTSFGLSEMEERGDSVFLEVCVDNVESLENAGIGGANRIELCSALSEGGLTPSAGLLKYAKARLDIPIFCMIRPRGGDFLYSAQEVSVMEHDLKVLKKHGADGFVFGALTKDAEVDVEVCKKLLELAGTLPCTFHRAFDYTARPIKSLETINKLGFARILTSGQKPSALEGAMTLRMLVKKAAELETNQTGAKLTILAGAGIKSDNVEKIIMRTGVREIHGSARKKTNSKMDMSHLEAGSSSRSNTNNSLIAETYHHVCDKDEVAKIIMNGNAALLLGKV